MTGKSLRLHLSIRRNALPAVNVVLPFSVDNSPTISKLLEQVNEVILLESGEWGLEDYVVELRNPEGELFECLHFQLVKDIIKDGETVLYATSRCL